MKKYLNQIDYVSMTFGGWAAERFTVPMDDFLCSICREVFHDAISINCGHSFCNRCLNRPNKRPMDKCPTCRTIIHTNVPSFSIRNKVLHSTLHCEYHEQGCEYISTLEQMDRHQRDCPFRPVSCEQCREVMTFQKMEEHLLQTCLYRSISCELCNESFRYKDSNLHHDTICRKKVISCSYCEWTGLREEDHAETCNNIPIVCRYAAYGCKTLLPRHEMIAHEKENHTHILCDEIDNLREEWITLKMTQLQDGPLYVMGSAHRFFLCYDLRNESCMFCTEMIKRYRDKYIGYYCFLPHANETVCISCMGTYRSYRSKYQILTMEQ